MACRHLSSDKTWARQGAPVLRHETFCRNGAGSWEEVLMSLLDALGCDRIWAWAWKLCCDMAHRLA